MISKISTSSTHGLIFATLMLASLAATSNAAQATCVYNNPNCVTGEYPDLGETNAWLDAAISQSDAGNAGADADNLPIPAIKIPPKGGVGKTGKALSADEIR